jgi:hypothetical protein
VPQHYHNDGRRQSLSPRRDRIPRAGIIVVTAALGAKPMKTGFGLKQRPDFIIHDWRNLGGPQPLSAPATKEPATVEQIGQPVKPVSVKEELNDEIGF